MKPTKAEWRIVTIIALAITLLAHLPLIIGYATAGPDEHFMGMPVYVTDANNHLHLALQAKEGHLLFTNRYTAEDVPYLLFNPYHLVIGLSARLFHTSVIASYTFYSVAITLAFFYVLYWFISHFTDNKMTRVHALLIAGITSGLGAFWLAINALSGWQFGSADLWVTDLNNYMSFQHPHLIISIILLLAIFIKGKQAIEEDNTKAAVWAGLLGLLLGFIHLFDIITMAAILTVWATHHAIKSKRWNLKTIKPLAIIGSITLPSVIYNIWVFFFHDTYKEWNALNQTITPGVIYIISGLGIPLFLAVYAMATTKKKQQGKQQLSLWLITTFILIYLPINVQRRFLLGITIPIAILAAIAITKIDKRYLKKPWRVPAMIAIITLASITTIATFVGQVQGLHDNYTDDYTNVKYLSNDEYDALQWLEANTEDEAVIMAPLALSNHIPAVSGNKVYVGHWAQTINYEEKKAYATFFYSGAMSSIVSADYVIAQKDQLMPGYLTERYANNEFTIYEN